MDTPTTNTSTGTGITGTVSNRYYLNPDDTISVETTTVISHNMSRNYDSLTGLEEIIRMSNNITINNYNNVILSFLQDLIPENPIFNKKIVYEKKKYRDLETEHKVCPICLEEFQEEDEVAVLECGHIFRPECIEKWGVKKPQCPMCKKEIKTR